MFNISNPKEEVFTYAITKLNNTSQLKFSTKELTHLKMISVKIKNMINTSSSKKSDINYIISTLSKLRDGKLK
jgi:hypothetical protein